MERAQKTSEGDNYNSLIGSDQPPLQTKNPLVHVEPNTDKRGKPHQGVLIECLMALSIKPQLFNQSADN